MRAWVRTASVVVVCSLVGTARASTQFFPGDGEFGSLLVEDLWPGTGDHDFNDAVVLYHFTFERDAGGDVTAVGLTVDLQALGADIDGGLALRLPRVAPGNTSATLLFGTDGAPSTPNGAPVAVSAEAGEPDAVFRIADDLRGALFPAAGPGFVNTQATHPVVEGVPVKLVVTFATPLPSCDHTIPGDCATNELDLAEAPFDLFLYRTADPGHQVHRSEYPGTASMHTGLFGTGDDGSDAPGCADRTEGARCFVDATGLPSLLVIGEGATPFAFGDATSYPLEQTAISLGMPGILTFAASGGQTATDFYKVGLNTTWLFTTGSDDNPPPGPDLLSYCGDAVVDAGEQCDDGSANGVGSCTITCVDADVDPDPFTFDTVTGATPSSQVTSNTVTLSGFSGVQPVTVTGTGAVVLVVDGVDAPGTTASVSDGTTLALRGTAPALAMDAVTWTVSLGTYSTQWTVSTSLEPTFSVPAVVPFGLWGDHTASSPTITPDGRYVAFLSGATNLGFADANGLDDAFVQDLWTGELFRIDESATGVVANDATLRPTVSANGRYAAFQSRATNLVPGDTTTAYEVFAKDLQTGAITKECLDASGTPTTSLCQTPSFSADGRYIAFSTQGALVPGDSGTIEDVYVRDRTTGTVTLASVATNGTHGDSTSYYPSISADGSRVAFYSVATTLVPNDTNGTGDVFVRDLNTGVTTRVSVSTTGVQADLATSSIPDISADGHRVVFLSAATTLVPGDTNGQWDVFVHDLDTGETRRVSVTMSGGEANDRSNSPHISADGRYVVFSSQATNILPSDANGVTYDVFVYDWNTGHVALLSTGPSGQGNGASSAPDISGDGGRAVFGSAATNLVSGDTNGFSDIFVVDVPAF